LTLINCARTLILEQRVLGLRDALFVSVGID